MGAVLTGSIVVLATPRGVLLTMFLYMLVTLLVGLPWTAFLLRRYYRR